MSIDLIYLILFLPYIIFITIGGVKIMLNFTNLETTYPWRRAMIIVSTIYAVIIPILGWLGGTNQFLYIILSLGLALVVGWRMLRKSGREKISQ